MEDDKHQPNAFALYLCEPTTPLTPPQPSKKIPFLGLLKHSSTSILSFTI